MTFRLSPGVSITETDLTAVVPQVATAIGGAVGVFQWGPVDEIISVSSENELKNIFGKPNGDVYEDWFSMANFLSYANHLKVARVVGATAINSVVDGAGTAGTPILIKNRDDYDNATFTDQLVIGKYPGVLGNSIKVHMVDGGAFDEWKYDQEFSAAPGTSDYVATRGGADDEMHIVVVDEDGKWTGVKGSILEKFAFVSKASDALKENGSSNYYKNVLANESLYVWGGLATEVAADVGGDSTTDFTTQTNDNSSDEVVDATIDTAGTGYAVDETFTWTDGGATVQATGKITAVGGGGEIQEIEITSRGSGYTSAPTTVSIETTGGTGAALTGVLGHLGVGGSLTGGVDDNTGVTDGERQSTLSLFQNSELVDVNLMFMAGASVSVGKWIIQNIAETRKDLVAFVSPAKSSVVNNLGAELASVKSDKSTYGSSSYGFMDNAWKLQYDRYNDVRRFVPLNGDIAGLTARTDFTNAAWFSPAGFNRGIIKNAIKLSWNPTSSQRDELYQAGINPVITDQGSGILLFGDKTMLSKPSAFDRINVRRLFIVLEKAIATAAKFQLFELNDEFTRSQFTAMIEPFLRNVQGRRGIHEFRVVCDETNNTGQVIDSNQFVADIFIKPSRSINFIQLNFVAVRTDVSFEEIVT